MKLAIDLLTQEFEKIKNNESVAKALRIMKNKNIKTLVVVNENGKYEGIVREKDLILARGNPETIKVSNFLITPAKIKRSDEIDKIARHMIESDSYILPVFNHKGDLIGIISIDSLLKEILEDKEISKTKVNEIMTKNPIVLESNESIAKAIKIMAINKISHLPIMENGKLVGIVSSHDIIEKVIKPRKRAEFGELAGKKLNLLSNLVSSIMSYPPITIDKNASVKEVIQKMFENNISCIIVGNAEGIITKRDLLELLVRPKEIGISVQISGIDKLNEFEKEDLRNEIKKFIQKMERIVNKGVLTIYIKKIKRKEGENCIVRMRFLLPGKNFMANSEGYRFLDTIQISFDKLEREIVEEFEKQKEKTREKEFFNKVMEYLGEIGW